MKWYRQIGDTENLLISDLMVLTSAAGWYIGRIYREPDGVEGPYSRESGYYKRFKEAKEDLDSGRYGRDAMELENLKLVGVSGDEADLIHFGGDNE